MFLNNINDFYTRVISSVALALLLLSALFFGEIAIKILIVFFSFITFFELENLLNAKNKLDKSIPFIFFSYILFCHFNKTYENQNLLLIFLFLLNTIIIYLFLFKKSNYHFFIVGTLLNWLFVSILFFLVDDSFNLQTIFFIILIICTCDTFAYLCGKMFGKLKIVSSISPNKTLEGYIGGVLFSIITSIIVSIIFNLEILNIILFSIIISFLSIAGDLYISFFKRKLKIKDISQLIPGHGGFLDRIDSWLFSFPLSYIILKFYQG